MLMKSALSSLSAIWILVALGAPAAAVCGASAESGTWVDPGAGMSALSRIEVVTTCENGTRGWQVRALSRCSRTECSWGYAKGIRRPDGTLAALFSTFAAERLLRLSTDGDTMSVTLINVFRSGDKENETQRLVFHRNYD